MRLCGAAFALEPVRIFVGEAVKESLAARLRKSITEQNSKLVHG
jgi:hypothetical protein